MAVPLDSSETRGSLAQLCRPLSDCVNRHLSVVFLLFYSHSLLSHLLFVSVGLLWPLLCA